MTTDLCKEIEREAQHIQADVIAWRRHIHQHPELSNRETNTAAFVADHLQRLGLEVQVGIAHTGVVALLKGSKPGGVVALRADMDALPIIEMTNLPFASKEKTLYEGKEVGIMHACGHDAHTAILMGVASVLSKLRDEITGTVKFIFQPAEEGAPKNETGGAQLMIEEGVLENPKPEAIFGLHIIPTMPKGITYRSKNIMANGSEFKIKVQGAATHGGLPWLGIDPIVISAQIILGIQTISSRQVDMTQGPVCISIGTIHGGNRANIVPEEVEMSGTFRVFNETIKEEVSAKLKNTIDSIAKASGAKAEILIQNTYPLVFNDPGLLDKMLPIMNKVAGEHLQEAALTMACEDFGYYAKKIPGLFFFLGACPKGLDISQAAPNHSPTFDIDESTLVLGVKMLSNLACSYLNQN